jgi:hypothetical protein
VAEAQDKVVRFVVQPNAKPNSHSSLSSEYGFSSVIILSIYRYQLIFSSQLYQPIWFSSHLDSSPSHILCIVMNIYVFIHFYESEEVSKGVLHLFVRCEFRKVYDWVGIVCEP